MNDSKKKFTFDWRDVLYDPMMTRELFRNNEIRANILIAKTMLTATAVILICWILNAVGILELSRKYALPAFLGGSIAFALPAIIAIILRGEKRWIKYMLLASATLVLAGMEIILTYNTPLLIIFPVIFSCRYYSGNITIRTAAFTTIVFAASAWIGAIVNFQTPDLNFAQKSMNLYVRDIMLLSFLPRWLTFIVISAFCYGIAQYGKKMVLEQDEISRKTARVNTELEMAGRIQSQALPSVKDLPENPVRRFSLAAEMVPAKEVGGDFYDFFYPDDKHIALIIADVADKGVGASLYMMMAKTLLASRVSQTLSPKEVLESVNRDLRTNSPRGMFVTVWLGILDLETGILTAANAGHEYPVLCRANGNFELIKDHHGFVLGGYKNTKYPEYTVQMNVGDTLFVYTDGVPEASNEEGQMFGLDLMQESLNHYKDNVMTGLINGVLTDIRKFIGNAAQFDDITMLAFQLQEPEEPLGIKVSPELENLYTVQDYIRETIGNDTLTVVQVQKLEIAVDEIFSNIVKYSQANEIRILCSVDNGNVRVTFSDDGIPFNPLETNGNVAPVPKATGGMGIYITRKIMNTVEYHYNDGRNELTVTMNNKENEK